MKWVPTEATTRWHTIFLHLVSSVGIVLLVFEGEENEFGHKKSFISGVLFTLTSFFSKKVDLCEHNITKYQQINANK